MAERGIEVLFLVVAGLLWGSLGAIFYSYLIYPLVVYLMVKIKGKRSPGEGTRREPTVSVIVSCYNEEGTLPGKLQNLREYQYPPLKVEYLFGSDGSSDKTNDILRAAAEKGQIRFFEFESRRGKAPMLNDLVSKARNEIVVFTDANTLFERDTILNLVGHFNDPAVGAVCGKLVLLSRGKESGGWNEESYWSYESWLKQMESDYCTLLGATGGIYAIRRDLFVPLPLGRPVTDDFLTPMQIVKKGYRVEYAPEAKAFEFTSGSIKREFQRKVRIGAQNFSGIPEFSSLLSPRAGFVAFALWSHKIVRWFVPHLALVTILSTAFLSFFVPLYMGLLVCQVLFLVLALMGGIADWVRISVGPLSLPYYILAMNLALFVGFWRFAIGKQHTTWEVLR